MVDKNFLVLVMGLLIAVLLLVSTIGFKCNRHARNLRTAKKVYKKINKIENDNEGWLFSYLRKLDSFVFEELILLALKKKGYKIYRNKRYTGDGGIDGKVKIDGEMYFIQAKRYASYINIAHVREFVLVCRRNNVQGLFIHTGKTGAETKELVSLCQNIKIISGQRLYELFIKD